MKTYSIKISALLFSVILLLTAISCKKKDRTADNEGKDWELVSELASPGGMGYLQEICLSDANTMWAIGMDGYSVKSTDAGKTWSKFVIDAALPANVGWYAICFANPLVGYIAGGSIIYKTIDGGVTWKSVFTKANGNTQAPNCIYFITPEKGYLCSDYGIIFITSDGGKTWEDKRIANLNNVRLMTIRFKDEQNGWIGGSGTLVKTTDGGTNWTIMHSLLDITFSNFRKISTCENFELVANGKLISAAQTLISSSDGGDIWNSTAGALNSPFGITMKNESEGFALIKSDLAYNDNKPMAHTYDGGKSWVNFSFDSYGNAAGRFFKFDKTLYGWSGSMGAKIYKYKKTW